MDRTTYLDSQERPIRQCHHLCSKKCLAVGSYWGIHWTFHASYHPQAAGAIERGNGCLKEKLKKTAGQPTKAQLPLDHTLQKVSLDYKCGNSPEGYLPFKQFFITRGGRWKEAQIGCKIPTPHNSFFSFYHFPSHTYSLGNQATGIRK